MREFIKHVIVALKEDDWEVDDSRVRHIKSRLVIELSTTQFHRCPIQMTWWERRVVRPHVRAMLDRKALERFVQYRIEPKKPAPYGDNFI